jgi:NADPH2:quinone reductase
MKAVGYKVPGPIPENASLVDIDLPRPVAAGHDILVEVMAVSVNPVDYKVRGSSPPADGDWKVLGWDAAGIVREVGSEVTQFKAGDEVYYAGSITRSGTNAQFHLVDARIVGKKPTSLDWGSSQKTENKAR